MGLTWTEWGSGIYHGRDTDGTSYAPVMDQTRYRSAYVAPRGCGRDGELALSGFGRADEAMDAVDRLVVAHLDEPS